MGLMALLESINNQSATATTATTATHGGGSVASVANVAVATPPNLKTERPYLRLVRAGDSPTESEMATIEQRQLSFELKGVVNAQAEVIAHHLMLRDRELDDRVVCLECTNWYAGRCKVRRDPFGDSDIYTLHRCEGFETLI
jgi:hypothetical protein